MLEFLVFYIIFSGFVTISFYLEDNVKWYWAIIFGSALYKIIDKNP